MNRDTTAQGTARVVESYRDHTRQSQRMHHYGPIVGLVHEARNAGVPNVTIRGFIGGVIFTGLFLAGMAFVISAFS